MRFRLMVYKEVYRRKDPLRSPLTEGIRNGIRGKQFKCRIMFTTRTATEKHTRIIMVSGKDIPDLKANVKRELRRYPTAEADGITFIPPKDAKSKQFISISNNEFVKNGRRYSSGAWIIAEPCSLDDHEILEFNSQEED